MQKNKTKQSTFVSWSHFIKHSMKELHTREQLEESAVAGADCTEVQRCRNQPCLLLLPPVSCRHCRHSLVLLETCELQTSVLVEAVELVCTRDVPRCTEWFDAVITEKDVKESTKRWVKAHVHTERYVIQSPMVYYSGMCVVCSSY